MAELVRMDLRRMAKDKVLWILPLVGIALLGATYALMALLTDPAALAAMAAQGMEVTAGDYADGTAILQYSTLQFLRETLFNGGFWLVLVGFGAGLFAVEDFSSGYAKNTFALLGSRWPYALARAASLLVLTAVTLGAMVVFTLVLAPFSFFPSFGGGVRDWLQLYVAGCLIGWAFSMLLQFCATLFRHEGWMVAAIFVLGCGVIPTLLGIVFRNLPFDLLGYTLFGCTQNISVLFDAVKFNTVVLVCLAWGAVYTALTTLVLEKTDIT